MPDTINGAEQTRAPQQYDSAKNCAAAAKSAGVKYWTFLLQSNDCFFYDELVPKPYDDTSITGSQGCADFYSSLSTGRKKRNTNTPTTPDYGSYDTIPTTVSTQIKNNSVPSVPKLAEPPNVDVYLNPLRQTEKAIIEEYMTNITRGLFDPPLPESAYPHLFRLLRHTNLPCVPSTDNKTQMILRWDRI